LSFRSSSPRSNLPSRDSTMPSSLNGDPQSRDAASISLHNCSRPCDRLKCSRLRSTAYRHATNAYLVPTPRSPRCGSFSARPCFTQCTNDASAAEATRLSLLGKPRRRLQQGHPTSSSIGLTRPRPSSASLSPGSCLSLSQRHRHLPPPIWQRPKGRGGPLARRPPYRRVTSLIYSEMAAIFKLVYL